MLHTSAAALFSMLLTQSGGPDLLKPQNRVIELDPEQQVVQVDVLGAPFVLTAIVMPEAYTQATCGNCTDDRNSSPNANWQLTLAPEERTVYLKPTRLPDATNPLPAFHTTLHITLESGYRINLNVNMADVRGSTPPDAEVSFKMPSSSTLAGRLAKRDEEREAAFQEKVHKAGRQYMAENLTGKLRCHDAVGRPYRKDRMVVRLVQHCSRGDAMFWAVFEVENRGNQKLELDQASLIPAATAAGSGGDGLFRFDRTSLLFNQRTRGVAFAWLQPDDAPPEAWQVVVTERGGKGREVTVDGIEY
ncbi:MAG: hypothetical protein ABIJ09_17630 [Pseudomonadota bacterium]